MKLNVLTRSTLFGTRLSLSKKPTDNALNGSFTKFVLVPKPLDLAAEGRRSAKDRSRISRIDFLKELGKAPGNELFDTRDSIRIRLAFE